MLLQKFLLAITATLLTIVATGQRLEKLWESDTTFPVPESVLYDAKGPVLFVSNIDGESGAKDGKGSISRVGTDSKTIVAEWVKGLNAPKGMGRYANELYVADVNVLRIYDATTGKFTDSVAIPGSVFLNDVTVDDKGNVYVSDSRTGTIHVVNTKRAYQVFIKGLKGPNGLLWHKKRLYYADRGELWFRTSNGDSSKVATGMEASTDGIVAVADDAFIVSCWSGIVYHVTSAGKATTLLDLRESKTNTADIGYDPSKKIVYIPTFFKNKIMAYQFVP